MVTAQQFDELKAFLIAERDAWREEWEASIPMSVDIWNEPVTLRLEDESFFAANQVLSDAIVAVIRARDGCENK